MTEHEPGTAAGGGAMDRREFCARAGAAALSLTILGPEAVHGTQANSRVRLGRNAAYANRLVTWDEINADGQRLTPKLGGPRG